MKKEDLIELRASIRREIIEHCQDVIIRLKRQNKDLIQRIHDANKNTEEVRKLLLGHLYDKRDRENELITEIDGLRKTIKDSEKEY